MIVSFTKMHCLGNDFIIIDGITQNIQIYSNCIKKLADRKTGIGCDQLLILEPPKNPNSDFFYKIYNSNGKEAEQCINGARCAARYSSDNGLVQQDTIHADCIAGSIKFIVNDNRFTANLGYVNPDITQINLSFLNNQDLNTNVIEAYKLTIGNPHVICLLPPPDGPQQSFTELYQKKYDLLAEQISNSSLFPNGINIGFAQIAPQNNIYLRVFERGAGETLSCGSNALAAFLIANKLKFINHSAKVIFKLGYLSVNTDANSHLLIDGPTNSIFSGKFKI